MSYDPASQQIYILAATGTRGPYHDIYAFDPASRQIKKLYSLDEQYLRRDLYPGFLVTGMGKLVINNRITPSRPELVVVDQETGAIDRYIDLPPSLSDPKLVGGEYLYRLRRWGRAVAAIGVTNGTVYVLDVETGNVLYEEFIGDPDFPPEIAENGMLTITPVVTDMYQDETGYRFDLINGFPVKTAVAVSRSGVRSDLVALGSQLAVARMYNTIERATPSEFLLLSFFQRRLDVFVAQ